MSPSKSIFFLAFALLAAAAATLPPPVYAVRDTQALQPSRWPFPGGIIRPRLPPPPTTVVPAPPVQESPPLPTIPASPDHQPRVPPLPTIPASPDHKPQDPSPPPPPSPSCVTPLARLASSCSDFLNGNNGVRTAPTEACCDALGSVVDDAHMCLCHAITGDINQIMPEPVSAVRIVTSLPVACRVRLPLQIFAQCSAGPVPPLFPSRS